MFFKIGRLRIHIGRMPALASRRVYVKGFDVGKVTSFMEFGKEDTAGGPIWFLGLGRFTFAMRRMNPTYVPGYWKQEEDARLKLLIDEINRQKAAQAQSAPVGSTAKVLTFKSPKEGAPV